MRHAGRAGGEVPAEGIGRPFSVLGDDASTMDQLKLLAKRHGWTCDVARAGGDYRAEFRPKT